MIENPGSARVKRVAKLAQKKERRATGLCLVEGPQAVRELLAHRPELVRELYLTETARERYPELATARGTQVEPVLVSERVLAAMSETVQPQGILAVAEQFDTSLESLAQLGRAPRLVAILHEVRDPGNAGAVLRAADAAAADAVIFAGESIDPFSPKVIRSTTGSLFHLPVLVERSLERVIDTLHETRQTGPELQVIAADVKGDDLTDSDAQAQLERPMAWLFGNEARGLTEEDRALADASLRVPIYGHAESLNLATAAAVCLYASAFAQRTTQDRGPGA